MKLLLLLGIIGFIVGYNYFKNIANRRGTSASVEFNRFLQALIHGNDAPQQRNNVSSINIRAPRNSNPLNMPNVKPIGLILGVLFLIITVWSSVYTVQPDEEGVVTRFEKKLTITKPGLHWKLPYIDNVIKLPTKKIHQVEFGFRTIKASAGRTEYDTERDYSDESKMLTGDLNVAEVEWVVQFQISNPADYIFNTKDPIENIKDVSESVMRRLVGDMLVSEVLTTGRVAIAAEAKVIMQDILENTYHQGIKIINIQLQNVNPPDSVKPAFNEVNSALQDQDKLINNAEQEYNRVIPEAKGKAEELIQAAEGDALEKINRAKGDVAQFSKVLAEYKKAPSITKKRMYLETMQKILKGKKILLVEPGAQKGIYPIYDINKTKGDK